jgi:fucokinase
VTFAAIDSLAEVARRARRLYAERVAGLPFVSPWWSAVIVTASSHRQGDRYQGEIQRRSHAGKLPPGVRYLVVPDIRDQRIGSGGATLNALHSLLPRHSNDLAGWWKTQRVLIIHSGGESRRLPQYSLSGKLFSALPVNTAWGDVSTVFDEMLAQSTTWAECLPCGLVVASGDVVLTFNAGDLDWARPGVSGVAMYQPAETGTQHGVYVTDGRGRVYRFLQKPSVADVRASGGLLEGGHVALDAGLLRFDSDVAARLSQIEFSDDLPYIDLYQHVTMGLTGQWTPGPDDSPVLHSLAAALTGVPFWCSTVSGDFTHVGTTRLFRNLMAGETNFSHVYSVQQRVGVITQPGLKSAGVVVDSVLSGGGELGPGAVAIECNLSSPVSLARGSILHGLEGVDGIAEAPEDTVLHQLPVMLPDGRKGVVIRVYGVDDDPKAAAAVATWFGRPVMEELRCRGIEPAEVWPGLPAGDWTLWNARLFPLSPVEEAWACARWLLGFESRYSVSQWRESERLSLSSSAEWTDVAALKAARARRMHSNWKLTALTLAASGSDIKPLLAHAPGIAPLIETAHALRAQARALGTSSLTEAASRDYMASMFFAQAGLEDDADRSRDSAFQLVARAVLAGSCGALSVPEPRWKHREVTVEGPARIDLGGGWSDTPPFCLDWGGTVVNVAIEIDGYPIRTTVRRLDQPVVRCKLGEESGGVEFHSCREILRPAVPGDAFSIPRTALQMTDAFHDDRKLENVLDAFGGGIEIETFVRLPMGSGLGTSSILAATTVRALAGMLGLSPSNQDLSDHVMRLEQLMTTGGGWQDQAGGTYPGAKLISSGPGLCQRLRVQPIVWPEEREAAFESLLVLYYTGVQRIAKGLLQQVVGNYLSRDTTTVQVLHSIKTLALEMAYAMQDGDWDHLGELLDHHWRLNQRLDPNTTNSLINALLEKSRPYIRGAKLAGAGGGGFLMLLAKSPEAAGELKQALSAGDDGGTVCNWRIAKNGLSVHWR